MSRRASPTITSLAFELRLTEGLVITIEPIISAGNGQGVLQPDRWTVRTADGSLSANLRNARSWNYGRVSRSC